MSRDILLEIVEKRKADIERLGWNFGFEIPSERKRKVVPFVAAKGAILEVKRASPSKGDIAPGLNAAETALSYVDSGACAISVLTETNYFKGCLQDLMDVANAVGEKAAVLRKDFLIDEKEIQIAYNCGADAVLLIARILEQQKMVSMAKKCQELGITAFIELRLGEDLEKLAAVCKEVDPAYIVCGVNSRDLRDFRIDLLTPPAMLEKIRSIAGKNARVVFESGIRTPKAARFAGSLGFTGMLLGEAAAKNPSLRKNLVDGFVNSHRDANADFWNSYSVIEAVQNKGRPLVKICGITNEDDALLAAKLGADFLGFIFCKRSPRNVAPFAVTGISYALEKEDLRKKVRLVGVITELDSPEAALAMDLLKNGALDVIQLHGISAETIEKEFDFSVPHYGVVNVSSEEDISKIDSLKLLGEPRILVDAKLGEQIGGTGTQIEGELVKKVSSSNVLWLAGGVTPENVKQIAMDFKPELIDVASGVELSPGKKDPAKLELLFKNLNGC